LKEWKPYAKNGKRKRRKWKAKEVIVRFVAFDSEAQRNEDYRLWVRSLLKIGKKEG